MSIIQLVPPDSFEAMVKLGILNSRMKDFYDIWLLSRQFDFDGANLAEAIRRNFLMSLLIYLTRNMKGWWHEEYEGMVEWLKGHAKNYWPYA